MPSDLLALQHTVGNRQVQRILAEPINMANSQQPSALAEENHEIKVQTKLAVGATLTYAIHHDGAESLNKDVQRQANEPEDEKTSVQTNPQVQRQVEPTEKNSLIAQREYVQRQTLALSENDAKAVARQLLDAAKQGRLVLQKRDLQQISQIAKTGMVRSEKGETVIPSDALVRVLQSLLKKALANKGESKSQLGILSLVRFGKKSGHSRGEAVDIHVYGEYSINMGDPKSALNGTLAVISNLPSGCYALGIPRTLPKDKEKLFFPANTPQFKSPSRGRIDKDIEYIENTEARDQFRKIIKDAANRGAIICYLFPDARDHLHIQLVPCPTLPPGKRAK